MSYLLFKRGNDLGGWIVFLIAAFVYGMTIEPTASFWDCPEFISCAEKLQVGHPPGAPFYMLVGNLFTQFASDASQVSRMVNFLNALLSAVTERTVAEAAKQYPFLFICSFYREFE